MSRATIDTLLSLDRWAAVLGLNPWHFAQSTTATWPAGTCDDVTYQYAWHASDKVAREDIARAVQQAEYDIAQGLGYWPAPAYQEAEEHPYPRYHARELVTTAMRQARGDRKSVQATWAKLQALGLKATALLSAGVAVTLPLTGHTVTLSVATSVTDPSEIAVYFRTTDGADAAASEQYRVRPIKVTISGGGATIKIDQWLLLLPTLWEEADAIDGDAAASYVTAVDVYRRYCDPSYQGLLVSPPSTTCTDDAAACAETTQAICVHSPHWDLGLLVPRAASWNTNTMQYDIEDMTENYDPDKVRFNYLAGDALGADGEMQDYWARAVAYYSLALLDQPLCSCDNVKARVGRWQEDLALNLSTQASNRSFQLDDIAKSCPWGTRRGAVFAWQRVRERQVGRGGIL